MHRSQQHIFFYQNDNARPHRASVDTHFYEQQKDLAVPQSGPQSHGERMRSTRQSSVRQTSPKCGRTQTLPDGRVGNLPQDHIRRLIRSLRRRCESVIADDGVVTKL